MTPGASLQPWGRGFLAHAGPSRSSPGPLQLGANSSAAGVNESLAEARMRLLDDLAGPPGRMLTLLAPQALRRYPDCTEASGGTLSGTLLVDTDEAGNGIPLTGCSSVTRIIGDLLIQNVGHLTSVTELANLMDISGALIVENTWNLHTVSLPRLEKVEGSMLFYHNKHVAKAEFPRLAEVGGAVIVQSNRELTSLALPMVQRIYEADAWVKTMDHLPLSPRSERCCGLLIKHNPKLPVCGGQIDVLRSNQGCPGAQDTCLPQNFGGNLLQDLGSCALYDALIKIPPSPPPPQGPRAGADPFGNADTESAKLAARREEERLLKEAAEEEKRQAAQKLVDDARKAAEKEKIEQLHAQKDADWKWLMLQTHNNLRAQHCNTPPLVWDDEIAATAQIFANKCPSDHSEAGTVDRRQHSGENMGFGQLYGDEVVWDWYSEVHGGVDNKSSPYNFQTGGFSMEHGHFTQLVWKGTTKIGCARKPDCMFDFWPDYEPSNVWICQYEDPGNANNKFRENVQPVCTPNIAEQRQKQMDIDAAKTIADNHGNPVIHAINAKPNLNVGDVQESSNTSDAAATTVEKRSNVVQAGSIAGSTAAGGDDAAAISASIAAASASVTAATEFAANGSDVPVAGAPNASGATAGASGSAESRLEAWQQAILDNTNLNRGKHCDTPPLAWDAQLAAKAQAYADSCPTQHSMRGSAFRRSSDGENIAWGQQHAEAAGHDWYEEVNGQGPGGTYSKPPYDFGQTTFSREHGHFTQVVWRETTAMGCGTKVCPELFSGWGDASVWVCQYNPGGNVGGKFQQNVGKLKPDC